MSSTRSVRSETLDLNPSCYKWMKVSDAFGSGWERSALAAETMWAHRPKEYHQIFLSASLKLIVPIPQEIFHSAVTESWLQLRSNTSELCTRTTISEDKKVCMRFDLLSEESQVREWCQESLSIGSSRDVLNFGELKDRILYLKSDQKSHRPVVLLVVHRDITHDTDELIETAELMLNADHQVTDGIGIRIMLSRYLFILAAKLSLQPAKLDSCPDSSPIASTPFLDIPTAPWICLLKEDQRLSGPEHEAAAAWNRVVLLDLMPQNLGLGLLQNSHAKNQLTHSVTICKDRSSQLLSKLKTELFPGTNITHLGHAAMVLALLRNTKFTPNESELPIRTPFYSPCWINGRRYIKYENSLLSPANTYIPICQTFAPIVFPDLNDVSIEGKTTVRDLLIKTCRIATFQYALIKNKSSIMPESVRLMEDLGCMMLQSPKNPPSAAKSRMSADPFFLSDGITETYIDRQYLQAIQVNDVNFAAHAEGPNVIVRMSSWRGQITISGEWRECDYERETVVKFLKDMEDIMSSIASNS